MSVPTRYRSLFTGQEIDQILASVKTKLDTSLLVNDFSGGTNKVASAELAKNLNTQIQNFKDPNYFKSILLSIPDNNIYTTEEKTKLASLSTKFVGSFPDAATRNANVNTANFAGGEFAFLVNDGNGYQEISMWNSATNSWIKTQLYNLGIVPSATVGTASTYTVTTLNLAKFSTCKVVITGKNGSDILTQEIMINSNGTTTYISVFGEVGSNSSLFSVSTSSADNVIININVTTTSPNTTIFAKKIAEI